MYCRSFEEHSMEVSDALEERDAKWLAMIKEIRQEIDKDWTADGEIASAQWGLKELETRMKYR